MATRPSRRKRLEVSKASYESFFDAVRLGDVQLVKDILTQGELDPNVLIFDDPLRQTVLHLAVRNMDAVIVQILLFQSRILVDVNVEDANGRRPIW